MLRTPLHYATFGWTANIEELTRLIATGADVNAVDQNGMTPLHFAAQSPSQDQPIRLLLEAGADPNALNRDSKSPLMIAVSRRGSMTILRMLLDAGADPTHIDATEYSPCRYIKEYGDTERKALFARYCKD